MNFIVLSCYQGSHTLDHSILMCNYYQDIKEQENNHKFTGVLQNYSNVTFIFMSLNYSQLKSWCLLVTTGLTPATSTTPFTTTVTTRTLATPRTNGNPFVIHMNLINEGGRVGDQGGNRGKGEEQKGDSLKGRAGIVSFIQ